MNQFLIVSLLLLSACSGENHEPMTRVNRTLSPEEKAEQRTLIEAFVEKPQAEVIGQTSGQHPRVFDLADRVLEWRDGRRGYHYVLRAAEEEGQISNVLIMTDGEHPQPKAPRAGVSATGEKILEIKVYIPVS